MRIHKFGGLDAGREDKVSRLPSFKAMQELCMGDERVKIQLSKERMEEADDAQLISYVELNYGTLQGMR